MALAGFGLDSLIEIGASTVVIWELSGSDSRRERRALQLIGIAFLLLATYLVAQTVIVLAVRHHAAHSALGIAWAAATALVMFALAAAKARTGRALDNRALQAEGRVTFIDGVLATAVLLGLALNATLGWWWADPLAGFVIVIYGVREGRTALRSAELTAATLEPAAPLEQCEERSDGRDLEPDAEREEVPGRRDVADHPAEVLTEEAGDEGERQEDRRHDRELLHHAC